MGEAFDVFVRVLEHEGCEPRVRGTSGMARCPAHEDRDPSMSIASAGDGRVLVHCFAGCETKDILAALGATWSLLFVDDGWPEGGVLHHYKPDPESVDILRQALELPASDGARSQLSPPALPMPRSRRVRPT